VAAAAAAVVAAAAHDNGAATAMSSNEVARIWLAVDALDRSAAPLGTALSLARLLKAELAALFVENIDLLRLAEFPQAAESRLYAPAAVPLALAQVESAMRAQAGALQRQLGRVALEQGVQWTFQTARGRIVQLALERASPAECVVVPGAAMLASLAPAGQRGFAAPRARQIGLAPALARYATGPGARPAAPLGREVNTGREIWALPGAGPDSQRVLAIAHRLLHDNGGSGRLLMPESPAAAAAIRDWLRERGEGAEWREASFEEFLAQRHRRGRNAGGVLLMPKPASESARQVLEGLLRRSDWPLVMV